MMSGRVLVCTRPDRVAHGSSGVVLLTLSPGSAFLLRGGWLVLGTLRWRRRLFSDRARLERFTALAPWQHDRRGQVNLGPFLDLTVRGILFAVRFLQPAAIPLLQVVCHVG